MKTNSWSKRFFVKLIWQKIYTFTDLIWLGTSFTQVDKGLSGLLLFEPSPIMVGSSAIVALASPTTSSAFMVVNISSSVKNSSPAIGVDRSEGVDCKGGTEIAAPARGTACSWKKNWNLYYKYLVTIYFR